MIGQSLGHYRIESKLGAGGMRVVYRAHDTHLGRPVAIKILPPESLASTERKRRFIREAKAASALIARGPVSIDDALDYSVQISSALAAAHGAGIIHRDIKPANVMVTESGHVKILDFGLAKLIEPLKSDPSAPTLRQTKTETGVIVGSVAYMSPEQGDGQALDAGQMCFRLVLWFKSIFRYSPTKITCRDGFVYDWCLADVYPFRISLITKSERTIKIFLFQ